MDAKIWGGMGDLYIIKLSPQRLLINCKVRNDNITVEKPAQYHSEWSKLILPVMGWTETWFLMWGTEKVTSFLQYTCPKCTTHVSSCGNIKQTQWDCLQNNFPGTFENCGVMKNKVWRTLMSQMKGTNKICQPHVMCDLESGWEKINFCKGRYWDNLRETNIDYMLGKSVIYIMFLDLISVLWLHKRMSLFLGNEHWKM